MVQFSASLLIVFFEQEAVVGEIRGMKKGVILSSKLPYLLGGVRNCHATNKSTKFHAPRREPFASSSRSGQVFRTFQVRTRAFSSIYVYVIMFYFISLF